MKKLSESLNPIERKIFRSLEEESTVSEIISTTSLKDVEILRAVQLLQNKNIVKLDESLIEVVLLDENGTSYQKYGLPEKRFLEAIKKESTLSEIGNVSGLSKEELTVSLGTLKSKAAIDIKKEGGLRISITDHGKNLLKKGFIEEQFLNEDFPKPVSSLKPEEKFVLENLKKRKKIVKIDIQKTIYVKLTETGKKLKKEHLENDLIEKTTSMLLKSGQWKGKKYRRYDVKINVPKIFAGRKQHYRRFLDDVRQKFMALGFKEMAGPIVESEFWDMDALFMPQFHSARDIHQGYNIRDPKYAKDLPEDVVKRVKEAHENGFGTGSKGWQYDFDIKKTHRHILRTHDTSISARTLASPDLEIPGKYFQIARCFRYDVIDATHLPDFNQVGGFIIDEDINFGHLKSLLRMFAKEFAETDQIRIKPSYFPFTEPSAEIQAKHPDLGWIELGGSGIFRPELVKPLVGRDVPVIAWGIGLDRLAMFRMGIKDIRQMFSHDLEFLRNVRVI